MIWVPITDVNGKQQYVNAERIERLEPIDFPLEKTRIWFVGNEEAYLKVQETPEEIMISINKERELIRKLSGQ